MELFRLELLHRLLFISDLLFLSRLCQVDVVASWRMVEVWLRYLVWGDLRLRYFGVNVWEQVSVEVAFFTEFLDCKKCDMVLCIFFLDKSLTWVHFTEDRDAILRHIKDCVKEPSLILRYFLANVGWFLFKVSFSWIDLTVVFSLDELLDFIARISVCYTEHLNYLFRVTHRNFGASFLLFVVWLLVLKLQLCYVWQR